MPLTGVFVPLITPFDAAGEVALDALEALAHQMLDGGAAGLVALGTTGEPSSLTGPEQSAVLDVVARVCRERAAALIVGANTMSAVQALASRPEVTAALTVVPPFVRAGEAGVEAYFRHLATGPVPLVVYHVPHRTAQELSADCLRRLAGIPNVVGIKYATGRIDADTVRFLDDLPDGFAVLGGDDVLLSPLLALGAHGGILASAHLTPALFVQLVQAWRVGDVATAHPLGRQLAMLSDALFAGPNPTVIKAALHARGLIPSPAVRLPLLTADPTSTAAALALLT
jgi:4-hydroxy-tetrahydrodipicolinate synthase